MVKQVIMERFQWLVTRNTYWGCHVFLGGLGAWVGQYLLPAEIVQAIIFVAGVWWEVGEYVYKRWRGDNFKSYGPEGVKRFIWDAFGDLWGEVLMAALVLF